MYSRILVPVDLENADKLTKALDLAAETAKAHDATVIYVGVIDSVPTISTKTEGQNAQSKLDSFATEQAQKHGIKVSDQVVLRGDLQLNVGPDIIASAQDANCDLILMASHVPGFLEHVFSSNAGYVASHAPMSVYVIR